MRNGPMRLTSTMQQVSLCGSSEPKGGDLPLETLTGKKFWKFGCTRPYSPQMPSL